MHMIQHMLLLDVVPILAILGLTKVILRPVTRSVHDLERRAGPLAHPAFAVILYVGVIWAWHIPAAYDLAVHAPGRARARAHQLRDRRLALLVASALADPRAHAPGRAWAGRLHGDRPSCSWGRSAWGSRSRPSALYPYYVHHARVWGISAIDDQSIAGLIMAVEQSLVMGIALVVLFVRALSESERAQQRRERYELVPEPAER